MALGPLLTSELPSLRGYLRHRTACDADADDLAQKVMIAASRGLPAFRAESSFRTWLLSIAHHIVADHFRAQSNRRAKELEFSRLASIRDHSGAGNQRSTVEQSVEAREQLRRCLRCIQTVLPLGEQLAVLFAEVFGCKDK